MGRDRDRGQHLGSEQFFEFVFFSSASVCCRRGGHPSSRACAISLVSATSARICDGLPRRFWRDPRASSPRQPSASTQRPPRTRTAHRTLASSAEHSRKAEKVHRRSSTPRAPTARRVRGASSLDHLVRVVVPSSQKIASARMALEEQRPRRPPFRMAQAPQSGPQGQSKTVTVTITGARRARRAARAPAPEGGCHHSAHPRPRNKQP